LISLEGRDLRKRTARTFDEASGEFDAARPGPWPSIKEIGSLRGKRVLDLGAGTGRNSGYLLESGASVVAADVSMGMLRVLGRKAGVGQTIHLVRCDALSLPFEDSVFDAVVFIAALHHIPEDGGRRAALGEVERVTVDGGVVLITVWAPRERPKGAREAVSDGGSGKDIYVPWADKGERYYHIFSPDELRAVLVDAGFSVMKLYHEQVSKRGVGTNLVAIATK
jgi:ubiquinone/menaquinone biosynthesis C-methylase UbiE